MPVQINAEPFAGADENVTTPVLLIDDTDPPVIVGVPLMFMTGSRKLVPPPKSLAS